MNELKLPSMELHSNLETITLNEETNFGLTEISISKDYIANTSQVLIILKRF